GGVRARLRAHHFGARPEDLVERLLADISLPSALLAAIAEHHRAGEAIGISSDSRFSQLLGVANYIAHGLRFATSDAAPVRPITAQEYRQATGFSTPGTIAADETRRVVVEAFAALTGEVAVEGDLRVDPPRTDARTWYARHVNYGVGGLDPVQLLLAELGRVEVSSRLPAEAVQLEAYSGLLVSVPVRDSGSFTVFGCNQLAKSGERVPPILYVYDRPGTAVGQAPVTGVRVEQYPVVLRRILEFQGDGEAD
ncbi:MAG: hypothetical protein KDD44_13775, partial [Bdellovibrionales bacterium]|nr:hypothetical protein [Bdellovibrionales bacterium]